MQTALLYVISSDESVVSVVNQRTRFEDAQLKFNKTGVVTITVMSAQNFNYQISFQISVIAGFSSFKSSLKNILYPQNTTPFAAHTPRTSISNSFA